MASPALQPAPARLVALDAFRGLTIAFMILVNDAGDGRNVYAPLQHSQWNGWTPTDVVFPSFLWIAGVSLTLSFSKRLAAGISRQALFMRTLRRAAIIYALGLVVYAAPQFNLSTQRLLGVLQRIAICYLAAAAIYLTTRLRGQILWITGLLSSYWLLMAFAPVPGYGHGRLDVEGNFAHYIDRIVLGAHNYRSTKTWDPEGIVSTLPAIATTLLGILCGHLLRWKKSLNERVAGMALAGVALIAAGFVCNIWLPINKKLWTTSFSLFMAGLDFTLFAAFLFLVDGRGYKRPMKPFVVFGMNSITVYMISELLDELLGQTGLHKTIYRSIFAPIASPVNASLLWALAYTGLLFLIAWIMYKRRWIVKV
ncbi:MAG TPA: heparan-alpha-glucosaminide N-acetyltransferase domain-containing protein [Bryobacteraceae bacterium]|nr:heparan-alpha-glucosaminide N-acetyltransferase domain-containing protein [Bryobacteraceae bacterium]